MRHLLGRAFAMMASLVLRLPVYDTQCGAKLFRASPEIRRLFDRPWRTNWVFDVELLARFIRGRNAAGREKTTEALYECPLTQWRDVAGSKVKPRDFFKAFFELAKVYWTYFRPRTAATDRRVPVPEIDTPRRQLEDPQRRRAA